MSTSHLNYAENRILLCKLHVASNARSGSYCPCWCWNLKNAILCPVRLAYKPYFFSQRIIFFFNNKSVNSIFSHGLWAERTGHWSVACLWRVVGARLLGGQRHAPPFLHGICSIVWIFIWVLWDFSYLWWFAVYVFNNLLGANSFQSF